MRGIFDRYRRHRFAWLFFTLLLTLAANPALEALVHFNPLELLLGVNLVAAILGSVRQRWILVLSLLGVGIVVARALAGALGSDTLLSMSQLTWLATTVLATVATAAYALRTKVVDGEHLFAALDTYLLVGLIFGVCYTVLDQLWPASFGAADASDLVLARGIYFSFVTLATLGYGDIVPISDAARGLAILEAVAGQMYLAVLVARLVTLYGREPAD